ncbi:MAG TPA: HEAT repeat domain-containing protein [Candidatus Angelobacter sp.]|nr:HEAT repeat domain-containing protein [Candidatus Angelobacter sp.]
MLEKGIKIKAGLAALMVVIALVSPAVAQEPTPATQEPKPAAQNPKAKAWQMIEDAVASEDTDKRVIAIRVLGLLKGDSRAIEMSEKALKDKNENVRAAGATALGELEAKGSIPKLHEALKDNDVGVVMAAAHALHAMGDPAAYEVYYAVLTGERKSGAGLLEQQKKMLKDPKKIAQFGFEQGLGFIPFASIGYGVVKAVRKDDTSPVKAAAAKVLAGDPDPRSGKALEEATFADSAVVRAAALDAIARRGEPSLIKAAETAMNDEEASVRFTAAAAVIRLSGTPKEKDTGQ